MFLLVKIVASGALVGVINLVARRSPVLGGALTAFPLIGYLSVLWLLADRRPGSDQAAFLTGMAWALVPTLAVVAGVALLLRAGWSTLPALAVGALGWGGAMLAVRALGVAG